MGVSEDGPKDFPRRMIGRRAYWSSTFAWTAVGLAAVLLYSVASDPAYWPWNEGPSRWLRLVSNSPHYVGLMLPMAAFAGGLAISSVRSSASIRLAVMTAVLTSLLSFGLIGLAHPALEHAVEVGVYGAPTDRYPLGAHEPWTLWRLRSYEIEQGVAGQGPITPLVRSHLYGFAFYFPFLVSLMGLLYAFSGFAMGVASRGRVGTNETSLMAWLVWALYVGSFHAGARVSVALITLAEWDAEAVALFPVVIPLTGAALLVWTLVVSHVDNADKQEW